VNNKDLKPAGTLAMRAGVKAIVYGPPGSAKTPLVNTCPRPVLLACEPGLLSMKGSNVPTWEGFTAAKVDEFFKWFFESSESKNYDTLAVDSVSQCADIYLTQAKINKSHGLQQYGEMAERTLSHLRKIYYLPEKHTYLIAKEDVYSVNSAQFKRPYYPGKELPREIAHLYDCIFHCAKTQIPGVMGEHLAFRCNGTYDIMARNRMGVLNDFEEPNFGNIVKKCGY
jgi:hypothetical protein